MRMPKAPKDSMSKHHKMPPAPQPAKMPRVPSGKSGVPAEIVKAYGKGLPPEIRKAFSKK